LRRRAFGWCDGRKPSIMSSSSLKANGLLGSRTIVASSFCLLILSNSSISNSTS